MRSKKERDDELYLTVKRGDKPTYDMICAFASTFGKADENIGLLTRYQVERFCMALVKL
jgi:hypothetical protein